MKNLDLLMPQDDQSESNGYRWATVTAVDPVRIRLDGETSPLDITPDSLVDVGWLDVDRRVWVQVYGRRVIILGQSGKDAYEAPPVTHPPPYEHPLQEWTELTLHSNFNVYGGASGVPPRATRSGEWVEVAGEIKPASTAVADDVDAYNMREILTLPYPFKPHAGAFEARQYICPGSSRNNWVCTVENDGTVSAWRYTGTASTSTWMPFNISFRGEPW